jgi:signal transduction histidine kinase
LNTKHSKRTQLRLQSRLLRVFLLQLLLISLLVVAGVLVAGAVAERLLVNRALSGEASYFWKQRASDPEFAMPNTLNLQSFMASSEGPPVPVVLTSLPAGQHRVMLGDDERIVYVSEHGAERLYLLFQNESVSRLALLFGLVPLTIALLLMYCLAYFAYVLSRRAVSPLIKLAKSMESYRFDQSEGYSQSQHLLEFQESSDVETKVLANALDTFIRHSEASLERERNFTRYASHELRTPLAVIQGSVSTLELSPALQQGANQRALSRIKRTCDQMNSLLGALLTLARRDTEAEPVKAPSHVNALVNRLVREYRDEGLSQGVSIELKEDAQLYVMASEAMLIIVLGNIIRNACQHVNEGTVEVIINAGSVSISDQGPGLDSHQQSRVFEPFYRINPEKTSGQGLGLAMVKSVCERQGWSLTLTSDPGQGASFHIQLNDSEQLPN